MSDAGWFKNWRALHDDKTWLALSPGERDLLHACLAAMDGSGRVQVRPTPKPLPIGSAHLADIIGTHRRSRRQLLPMLSAATLVVRGRLLEGSGFLWIEFVNFGKFQSRNRLFRYNLPENGVEVCRSHRQATADPIGTGEVEGEVGEEGERRRSATPLPIPSAAPPSPRTAPAARRIETPEIPPDPSTNGSHATDHDSALAEFQTAYPTSLWQLVQEGFDRCARARKCGKVAKSIIIEQLEYFDPFDGPEIRDGTEAFLRAEFAGNPEKYWRGCIRGAVKRRTLHDAKTKEARRVGDEQRAREDRRYPRR